MWIAARCDQIYTDIEGDQLNFERKTSTSPKHFCTSKQTAIPIAQNVENSHYNK